jgi:hypothetical protein
MHKPKGEFFWPNGQNATDDLTHEERRNKKGERKVPSSSAVLFGGAAAENVESSRKSTQGD